MFYYDLFYIQRFCYLSWIYGMWNKLQLQLFIWAPPNSHFFCCQLCELQAYSFQLFLMCGLKVARKTVFHLAWPVNPFQPKLILVHTTVTGTCRHAYKTCKNWPICSYVGWHQHSQPNAEKSAQCSKMTTGANGQKACILRTDEKHDAIWHHGAGKG